MTKQRIGHPPMREIERVQWIPGAVRSGSGGRRIGHLTYAMVPKSRSGKGLTKRHPNEFLQSRFLDGSSNYSVSNRTCSHIPEVKGDIDFYRT